MRRSFVSWESVLSFMRSNTSSMSCLVAKLGICMLMLCSSSLLDLVCMSVRSSPKSLFSRGKLRSNSLTFFSMVSSFEASLLKCTLSSLISSLMLSVLFSGIFWIWVTLIMDACSLTALSIMLCRSCYNSDLITSFTAPIDFCIILDLPNSLDFSGLVLVMGPTLLMGSISLFLGSKVRLPRGTLGVPTSEVCLNEDRLVLSPSLLFISDTDSKSSCL
mmetsp:Transcript_10105/g.22186  ORF Transcript_10105/g.22186 Transcript_10105/m.22186 type:complete len:218 (-) Transcript_10105:12-665(-)